MRLSLLCLCLGTVLAVREATLPEPVIWRIRGLSNLSRKERSSASFLESQLAVEGHQQKAAPSVPPQWAAKVVFKEKLGQGGFGSVYLTKAICSNRSDALVAVKVMDKSKVKKSLMDKELMMMSEVSGLSDYVVSLAGSPEYVDYDNKMYLMMPYINAGEFFDALLYFMQGDADPPFDSIGVIFALWVQIVKGVAALHERGIIHMDLKPENIMLNCRRSRQGTRTCSSTVIDLGLACKPRHEEIVIEQCLSGMTIDKCGELGTAALLEFFSKHSAIMNRSDITIYNKDGDTVSWDDDEFDPAHYLVDGPLKVSIAELNPCAQAGTPGYAAPEVINETGIGQPSNDVWALGTMFYMIVLGIPPPFFGSTADAVLHYGVMDDIRVSKLKPEIATLIQGMLQVDPKKRIAVGDILHSVQAIMKVMRITPEHQAYEMLTVPASETGAMFVPPKCLEEESANHTDVQDRTPLRSDCLRNTVEDASAPFRCGFCPIGICNRCCKCRVIRHGGQAKVHLRLRHCE